jgi:hypothetical protein
MSEHFKSVDQQAMIIFKINYKFNKILQLVKRSLLFETGRICNIFSTYPSDSNTFSFGDLKFKIFLQWAFVQHLFQF